jgi:hypothetical protein
MRDLIGAIKDAVIYDTTLQDVSALVTLFGLCYLLLLVTQ